MKPQDPSKLDISFWILMVINLFVGGMVGLERTVVPLLGEQEFGLERGVAVATFIVSFAIAKAVMNLFAGFAADRFGRKGVLIIGWILGLPVPLLLIWAPSWNWVLIANVLLGVNQALTWSMTINMMVDLVPPRRRGFAAGINEFAGYLGVSLLAFLTGLVAARFSLRPEPFYLGIVIACLGGALSFFVKETTPAQKPPPISWVPGVGVPSLLGLATNLKDGLVWLALPLLLSARGFSLSEIGLIAGMYPLIWALGQPFFGPMSDRIGRRLPIALGMALQGLGLILLANASNVSVMLLVTALLGLGTALVYPTLIASVADRVVAERRATALGIYRFFRDSGYAIGAIIAGAGLVSIAPTMMVTGIAVLGLALIAAWQLR